MTAQKWLADDGERVEPATMLEPAICEASTASLLAHWPW